PSTRTSTLSLHDALPISAGANLFLYLIVGILDKRSDRPIAPAPADIENEPSQQRCPIFGVCDFRMELNPEHFSFRILHCGDRRLDRKSTRLNSSHLGISY